MMRAHHRDVAPAHVAAANAVLRSAAVICQTICPVRSTSCKTEFAPSGKDTAEIDQEIAVRHEFDGFGMSPGEVPGCRPRSRCRLKSATTASVAPMVTKSSSSTPLCGVIPGVLVTFKLGNIAAEPPRS